MKIKRRDQEERDRTVKELLEDSLHEYDQQTRRIILQYVEKIGVVYPDLM